MGEDRPVTHVSGWRVVVPVKGGDEAKTRLALPRRQRQELALAMALDCLTVCRDTPGWAWSSASATTPTCSGRPVPPG